MPEGMDTLNSMLSHMGDAPAPAPTAPAPAPEPTPVPATAPTPEPNATPAAPAVADPAAPAPETAAPAAQPAQPEDPEQVFSGSKQNQAFAQLRTQNKTLLSAVTKMGQILGVENITEPEKLVEALQQRFLQFESTQQNIPLPYLQQMEQDRQARMQLEADNFKTQATLGFQKVKDTFALDNTGLLEFAKQLDGQGINPYSQPVDLLSAYRTLNFDKIVQKEKDKAVQEALSRQNKAVNQSSTPGSAVGKPPETGQPITTIAGLEQLLNGFGK